MCGLVLASQRSEAVSSDVLEDMAREVSHRGPDDSGRFCSRGIGLAHERLSIVDLSERGRQPFFSEKESIVTIVNGEIYNHESLREELKQAGHEFRSNSDSEVVGHLYEEQGRDLVKRLDGMFAFCLLDRDRDRILLARDSRGIKPLYFYQDDENFVASSEIKSLFEHPAISPSENKSMLPFLFTLGFTPSPHTLFEGVRKVKPGEVIEFHQEGWSRESFEFDPPSQTGTETDPELARIFELLDHAVEKRLMSDVEVGVLLSGGLDSSVVSALAQRHADRRLRTFTVEFDTAGQDEKFNLDRDVAKQVSEKLGTHHETVQIGDDDPLGEYLNDVVYHLDEPQYNPTSVTEYLLYKKIASRGVKVILSGLGADELFAGYDRHRLTKYEQWMDYFPGRLLQLAAWMFPDRLSNAVNRLSMPAWERYMNWYTAYDFEAFEQALTPEFRESMEWDTFYENIGSTFSEEFEHDALEYIIRSDFQVWLPDLALNQTDKTSMAHALEVRVPFLDRDLCDLVMNVPARQKVSFQKREKWLLRDSVREKLPSLPDKVFQRKKQGLNSPGAKWLREGLQSELENRLSPGRLKKQQRFQPDVINQWQSQHHSASGYYFHELWRILSYQIWLDKFNVH